MATRFYLGTATAAPTAPGVRADWERSIAAFARHLLSRTKTNSALADVAALMGSTATSQTCWHQWVSEPLIGDQTITGTFSMVVRVLEGGSTEDAHLAFMLRVMQGDSTTLERGLLNSVMATSSEFPTTTPATRIHSAVANSSVSALHGDRLVLEVGVHAVTAANAANLTFRFGDPSATADFALTAGLTTDLVPWIEVSQTLVFEYTGTVTEGAPAGASAATGALTFSGTGTVTAPVGALDATGTIPVETTGTATETAPAAALAGTGSALLAITGTATESAPVAALASTAATTFTGTASVTTTAPALAASGTYTPLAITGTATVTALAPALSGSQDTAPAVTGTATVTTTVGTLAVAATLRFSGSGTGAAPAPALGALGTAIPSIHGEGQTLAAAAALAGTGRAEPLALTGAATLSTTRPQLHGYAWPIPMLALGSSRTTVQGGASALTLATGRAQATVLAEGA